jgi:hypothetical protein
VRVFLLKQLLFLILTLAPNLKVLACTAQNVDLRGIRFIKNDSGGYKIIGDFETASGNAYSFNISFIIQIPGQNPIEINQCFDRDTKLTGDITLIENWISPVQDLSNTFVESVKIQWSSDKDKKCIDKDKGADDEGWPKSQCREIEAKFTGLPVIWHKFSTKLAVDFKSVELRWSTLKEWESSHFEVERSLNGIASFEKIGEEKSAGWSDTEVNYSFLDRTLPAGGSRLYYRIKQVDFDGTTDYSPTQMVELPMSNTNLGWQAYPNPTQNNRLFLKTLAYVRNRENPITIKLYTIDSAHSFIFQTYDSEMDLSSYLKKLPKGLVIIEISNTYSVEFLKVIHQ